MKPNLNTIYKRLTLIFFFVSILIALIYLFLESGNNVNTMFNVVKSISISSIIFILPLFLYEKRFGLKIRGTNNNQLTLPFYSLIVFAGIIVLGLIVRLINIDISIVLIVLSFVLALMLIAKFIIKDYKEFLWSDFILLGLIAFVLSFIVWGDYYQSPHYNERLILGLAHKDNLWHIGISNIIRSYLVPSTGYDGLPFMNYHWGSHYIFALICELFNIKSIVFYNLTYTIVIIPFLFYHLFLFILEYLNYKEENYSNSLVFFVVPVIFIVGFIPEWLSQYKELYYRPLRSESFVVAIFFSFIIMSIVISNLKRRIIYNRFIFYFLVPLSFIILGLMKISVSYILFGVYSYIYLRKKLFNTSSNNISYLLSLIAFTIAIVFRLKFDLVTILKVFGALAFLAGVFIFYQKYLSAYKKRIFAFGGIVIAILIMLNPLLFNYENLYFKETIKINILFYIAFYYFWVIMAIVIVFYKFKITTLKKFGDVLLSDNFFEIEILLVVSVVGILPATLNKLGFNTTYFSSLQMWSGLILVTFYAAIAYDKLNWNYFKDYKLFKVLIVGSFILFILYNTYNNYVGSIKSALKNKSKIEENYIKKVSSLTDTLATGNNNYLESIVNELSQLDELPVKIKYSTCLYIPKTNNLFWEIPAGEKYSLPSIFTALTGIALINGFPDNIPPNYGYNYYTKPFINYLEIPDDLLNERARKKGFKNIIILKNNFNIEFRNLDKRFDIPENIKEKFYNRFKQLNLYFGYTQKEISVGPQLINDSLYINIQTPLEIDDELLQIQYCEDFPLWKNYNFDNIKKQNSDEFLVKGNQMLMNGNYKFRFLFKINSGIDSIWIGHDVEVNFPNYEEDFNDNFSLRTVYNQGFGQGIEVAYNAPSKISKIDIQYRKIDEVKWINAAKKRSCLYNNFKFYGKSIINEERHHLLPGEYEVRLRYNLITGNTDWIGKKINVPLIEEEEDAYTLVTDSTLFLKPFFNPTFGWGIKCYLSSPENSKLDLDYKNVEDYSWNVYFKDRERVTISEIHTREVYQNIMGNIPPGEYIIRYRYKTNDTISNWMGKTIQMDSLLYDNF